MLLCQLSGNLCQLSGNLCQLMEILCQLMVKTTKRQKYLGGNPNSHIPAHESLAVAAPFRA